MPTSPPPSVHPPAIVASTKAVVPWWVLAAVAALSLTVALSLTLILAWDDAKYNVTVRDVLAVARAGDPLPYYTGWVTGLGVIGWMSSATVGVLAGALSWRLGQRVVGRALVAGGLVSAALGADDLFMFHDAMLVERGVPETTTLAVLGAAAALWGLTHLRVLLAGSEAVLLVLAAVWFAHSMVVEEVEGLFFHEEASKAAAIVCWTAWFWVRAVRALRQVPSGVTPEPAAV